MCRWVGGQQSGCQGVGNRQLQLQLHRRYMTKHANISNFSRPAPRNNAQHIGVRAEVLVQLWVPTTGLFTGQDLHVGVEQ